MIGVVNIVSPKPIANRDFMALLRKAVGISFGIPISEPLLKFGAIFIRTQAELVLKSRNVIPKRLQENGFEFEFDTLEKSLKDLTKKEI